MKWSGQFDPSTSRPKASRSVPNPSPLDMTSYTALESNTPVEKADLRTTFVIHGDASAIDGKQIADVNQWSCDIDEGDEVADLAGSLDEKEMITNTFNMYDKDCSGSIERSEFNNLCCDLGQDFDQEELDEAFSALDEDESGKISFEEFMKWCVAGLDKGIADLSTDRPGVQSEFDAVIEYLEHLKELCIAKPESYEERKAQLGNEIDGLKEALKSLETEASFLQGTRPRRTLRGQTQLSATE